MVSTVARKWQQYNIFYPKRLVGPKDVQISINYLSVGCDMVCQRGMGYLFTRFKHKNNIKSKYRKFAIILIEKKIVITVVIIMC